MKAALALFCLVGLAQGGPVEDARGKLSSAYAAKEAARTAADKAANQLAATQQKLATESAKTAAATSDATRAARLRDSLKRQANTAGASADLGVAWTQSIEVAKALEAARVKTAAAKVAASTAANAAKTAKAAADADLVAQTKAVLAAQSALAAAKRATPPGKREERVKSAEDPGKAAADDVKDKEALVKRAEEVAKSTAEVVKQMEGDLKAATAAKAQCGKPKTPDELRKLQAAARTTVGTGAAATYNKNAVDAYNAALDVADKCSQAADDVADLTASKAALAVEKAKADALVAQAKAALEKAKQRQEWAAANLEAVKKVIAKGVTSTAKTSVTKAPTKKPIKSNTNNITWIKNGNVASPAAQFPARSPDSSPGSPCCRLALSGRCKAASASPKDATAARMTRYLCPNACGCSFSQNWCTLIVPASCSSAGPAALAIGGGAASANLPRPPTGCQDTSPSCATWAAGGECSRNPLYMRPSCKKSCRLCACGVDSSPWCPVWAFGLRNECTANPAWMGANCRFSCCNPRGSGLIADVAQASTRRQLLRGLRRFRLSQIRKARKAKAAKRKASRN